MEGLGAEGAGHLFSGMGPHRPCIGAAAGWEELAKSHLILFCSLGRPTVFMASSCPLVDPGKRGSRGVCRAVGPSLGLADVVVSPGHQGVTTCLPYWSDSAGKLGGERSGSQESRGPEALLLTVGEVYLSKWTTLTLGGIRQEPLKPRLRDVFLASPGAAFTARRLWSEKAAGRASCAADVEELSRASVLDQAHNVCEGLGSQWEPLPREAPEEQAIPSWGWGCRGIGSLYSPSLCCEKCWKKLKGLDQPVLSRLRL